MHLAGLLLPPDGAAHSPFVGLDGFDLVFVLTVAAGEPYRYVRHPGYVGYSISWVATAFALG
jgi:hypothetical protein